MLPHVEAMGTRGLTLEGSSNIKWEEMCFTKQLKNSEKDKNKGNKIDYRYNLESINFTPFSP